MNKMGYFLKSIFEEAKAVSIEKDGKPFIIAILDIMFSGIVYGASPQNYRKFDFYKLNNKQRKSFVTNRTSELLIHKYNQKEYRELFEDKIKFAQLFKPFFKRLCLKYPECGEKKYNEFCKNVNEFICKPLFGSQGRGIIICKSQQYDYKQLATICIGGGVYY